METTEEVSSHRVEECAERHKSQRSAPFAKEYQGALEKRLKKHLETCRAGRKSRKRPHAGRRPETKWEIPAH